MLGRAEGVDREGAQRVNGKPDCETQIGVRELLDQQQIGDIALVCTAVLFGKGQSTEAQLGKLLVEREGVLGPALVGLGGLAGFLGGELTSQRDDVALILVQQRHGGGHVRDNNWNTSHRIRLGAAP